MLAKIHARYRLIVEQLGLRQLDVYRVKERGVDVDILRLYDPATGKVVVVNLGTVRESLDYKSFLNRILRSLEEAGIRVSEKRLSRLLERL